MENRDLISLEPVLESRHFNLLAPHCFSFEKEEAYIRNNMTIDFHFGFADILDEFVSRHPRFEYHLNHLKGLTSGELSNEMNAARRRSVLLTVIMLTGKCNANCSICCTDRRFKGTEELSLAEIRSILLQVKELGCKTIYIPGEGEPLLDKNFWEILKLVKDLAINVITFTNGLILSNDELALAQWGIPCDKAVIRLAKYPVYMYYKLWSLNPDLLASLMRVPAKLHNFREYQINHPSTGTPVTIKLPQGLYLLLRYLPKERIGVESVVMRENFDEIRDILVPFIKATGIKSYIEPLIHAGRYLGKSEFDVDFSKLHELYPWVNRLSCKRLGYKIVVHNSGYLSFGIQVPLDQVIPHRKEEFCLRSNPGKIKNIFKLVHSNELLVRGRYAIEKCLCEEVCSEIARYGCSEFLLTSKSQRC